MRELSFCLAAASIVLVGFCGRALAASFPTNAYDATYKKQKMTKQGDGPYANDGGVSDYRFATDGQGRIRIETEPANQGFITGEKTAKTVTIFDYPNGESYILLERQKLAMRSPLKKDSSLAPIDEQRVKELNGKSLGPADRSGHKCHGWEYELNGVKYETWTADDLGCPIDVYTMNADQTLDVMHLFKFVKGAPPPDSFDVPRDFKMSSSGSGSKVQ